MTNTLTHRRMIVFHGGQKSKVEGQRKKIKTYEKVYYNRICGTIILVLVRI
jgi:hypothetical protein